jgi:hypothetical protein
VGADGAGNVAYRLRMSCCGPKSCRDYDEDREGVSEADLARFGGDDIECPSCGADVYHDASRCGKCGHAMTHESTDRKTPAWVPLTAVVLVALLVVFFVF